jgi:tol-pal system protein YbgF
MKRVRRPLAASLCLLALMAAGSARAGIFDDDEARKQIADLGKQVGDMNKAVDARLINLENALKAQGLVDLLAQVEALKSDLAKLRGQIEVMGYDIEQAQKRQRDLYVDLDTRLRKLESSSAAPIAATPAEVPPAPVTAGQATIPPTLPLNVQAVPMPKPTPGKPVGEAAFSAEQRAYDAASEQVHAGHYAEAQAQFQAFAKAYPRSPLAPSAQYWVGNAQYAQRDFAGAIATQRALVKNFPDSQKVPDALLNIASAQSELGDTGAARKTLDDLVARFPQSEAADKAKKRLAAAH